MRKGIYSISGWVLMIGGVAGIVMSIFGLTIFRKNGSQISEQLLTTVDLLGQTFSTTESGLEIINTTLEKSEEKLAQLETTFHGVADAVGDTRITLLNIGDLIGDDLTLVIRETQASLSAVQTSAVLVDDTLKIISAIPFIGAKYAPTRPLSESVEQINTSLEELPVSFTEIQTNLDSTSTDLSDVELDIEEFSGSLSEINDSLNEAQGVIEEYKDILRDMQNHLAKLHTDIPKWFKKINIGVSLFIAWMTITSFGLFSVGLMMYKQDFLETSSGK
ncbi:MAG: septation ring formation regulator EzrA [Anaerolineaceae bacterium]|nr:septation ring formation regulator EzrA [Anaerolineaceae bacterium]